jgi:hypothetical protein
MKSSFIEGMVVFLEDGEAVAVARKNGSTKFYHLTEMGFEDIAELYGTNPTQIKINVKKDDTNQEIKPGA